MFLPDCHLSYLNVFDKIELSSPQEQGAAETRHTSVTGLIFAHSPGALFVFVDSPGRG